MVKIIRNSVSITYRFEQGKSFVDMIWAYLTAELENGGRVEIFLIRNMGGSRSTDNYGRVVKSVSHLSL